MQVTSPNDHITHAVIGGGEAIDVTITNNAEFFTMMSSTMYKDQILAVVREVLCNAWDAHIDAGVTDTPVEVTLTEEMFVVRDFGKGIPHKQIGPVYGVMGGSTKRNDGMQTGGFGLGCKSPWAYNDHFEVVSQCEGTSTIYNMSKSNSEAAGKPTIIPLASFPTKETGLKVSVRINTRADMNRFRTLVQRIARNGDMLVKFNGELVERINFDATKESFLYTRYPLLDVPTPIMVRYGNVIYPVDPANGIYQEHKEICDHLATLRVHNNEYRLVLQAVPHSITVQPSREGLSMQTKTIQAIKVLMTNFLNKLKSSRTELCWQHTQHVVDDAVANKRIGGLLLPVLGLPLVNAVTVPNQMHDLLSMTSRYMESNYPKTLEFRKKDLMYRLRKMIDAKQVDRGMAQTFMHHLKNVKHNASREPNDWLQKRVIAPLIMGMQAKGIDPTRLYVVDDRDNNCVGRNRRKEQPIVPAISASPAHMFTAIPYLRKIVVVATARRELVSKAMRTKLFKTQGGYTGFMFYHAPAKRKEHDAIIKFFKDQGMQVLDLIPEVVPASEREPAQPKVKPLEGLPVLEQMLKGNFFNTRRAYGYDAERINKPEFVVNVSYGRTASVRHLPGFTEEISVLIAELFGDKGGVTNNINTYNKWLKQGVPSMKDYLLAKLTDFILTNKNVQNSFAFDFNRLIEQTTHELEDDEYLLLNAVYSNPQVAKAFGIKNELMPVEAKMLQLYSVFKGYNTEGFKHVVDHVEAVKLHKNNFKLFEQFASKLLTEFLDVGEIVSFLKKHPNNHQTVDKIIALLKCSLK